MKKLIIVIAVFMGIMAPKAYIIEVVCEDNTFSYEYELEIKNGYHLYNYYIDENTQIEDYQFVKNLAYVGSSVTDQYELVNATIEKMILENANQCDVNIYDENNEKLDTYYIEEALIAKLQEFKVLVDIDNTTYQISLNEKISLDSINTNLMAYQTTNISWEATTITYTLSGFLTPGTFTYEFTPLIETYEGKIYSSNYVYDNFSINVEVTGNTLLFVSTLEEYSFDFEIYDTSGNYLKSVTIDNTNNYIYYEDGIDIVLKDVSEDSIFYKLEDIYVYEDDSDIYEINLDDIILPISYDISISTQLIDLSTGDATQIDTWVVVYDDNDNLLYTCESSDGCTYHLAKGTYKVKDMSTGETTSVSLSSSEEFIIKRYYINGLISSDNVISIADEVLQGNGVYVLNNKLEPGIYQINIDDSTYIIDLTKTENYVYLDELGMYYKVDVETLTLINNNEDATINSEMIENIPETDNTVINIDVPDTNLRFNGGINEKMVARRRYYFKYMWM